MKTATQMRQAQNAEMERAMRFETLTNDRARLANTIMKLSAATVNVTALEQMLALVPDVPAALTNRGTRFVTGGFIVRDLLSGLLTNALEDARRRADDHASTLDKATAELAQVEDALKEFD